MSSESENAPAEGRSALRHLRNWISLAGLIIVGGSFFAFLLLTAFDYITGGANPYLGILSYIVAPLFFLLGSSLVLVGWIWHFFTDRASKVSLRFDLKRARDRRIFMVFVGAAMVFMFVSAVGSYQTYTYANSNEFCGTVCHSVMAPHYVEYENDVHGKISCIECHVGPGPVGALKAKWHGIYKVYSISFDKYPTPLRADPHYFPEAKETCLDCHQSDTALKDVVKTYHHYLSDDENTPFSVSLRLKLGPDRVSEIQTRGIHWHAQMENKVEFTQTLENPDIVPWIRVTNPDGSATEYEFQPDEDDEVEGLPDLTHVTAVQTMDCLDCHSRPAHVFPKPNDLIETGIANGEISHRLPELKYIVAKAMSDSYTTREEAFEGITKVLSESYEDSDPHLLAAALNWTKSTFSKTIFPEMRADWRAYPDLIGHKDTLGCFRCHDDKHVSFDGSKTLTAQNCNMCHDVIAQGTPGSMTFADGPETEFDHPDGSYLGFTCAECHTGGLQLE